MAESQPIRHDRAADKASVILQELLRGYPARDFAIELWDGTRFDPDAGRLCRFTWHIKKPSAVQALFRSDRQARLGEAYVCGDFDVSGDLLAVFPVADYLLGQHLSARQKLRMIASASSLSSAAHPKVERTMLRGTLHSKSRDRQAVSFHYDVSNDFYQLLLDQRMVYSCAYFKSENDSIDRAQEQKLDYICRKLRLKPGERLLDIGCGWGGFILHATRNYGVQALGITLSEQQLVLARERIAKAGLASRCEVRLVDYREAEQFGIFDKVVSVGMVEHVGESNLADYFGTAFRLLKPGGIFLNHGIGRAGSRAKSSAPTFTDVYVFPDADLVPIASTLNAAEQYGFEVRDVENLREHYFLTLVEWLRRLERNEVRAKQLVGEMKYRTWRLYLAGSAYYFRTGKLDLYQTLLLKPTGAPSGLPLTRSDWYQGNGKA